MSADIHHARTVLAGIALFEGYSSKDLTVTRLGGLTNLVYRVQGADIDYCLRLPGKGTDEYIDREVEAHAARAAASAGVSPQVLYTDAQSGIMVAQFLDGAQTMSPDSFKSVDGSVARAGQAFAQLHNSGQTFNFRFELFAMIDEYLGILATKDVEFPDGYHDVLENAQSVRRALETNPAKLCPCHCDPLCENFLDDGVKMWIVDWEYSGMNDPLWDLGDLSVEGTFSPAQDTELLNAYYGRSPTAAEQARLVIYKAMCDLLWTLWGLIQHANGNEAEDFWAYSVGRFERCRTLMNSKNFSGHINALAK